MKRNKLLIQTKKKVLCYLQSIELSERFQMQKTIAAVLFHYVKF